MAASELFLWDICRGTLPSVEWPGEGFGGGGPGWQGRWLQLSLSQKGLSRWEVGVHEGLTGLSKMAENKCYM